MKTNENIFVLELCKFLNPDRDKLCTLMKEGLDYPYILGQLLYNRVGAIGYYTLQKADLLKELNREFRNTLKELYGVGMIKTNSYIRALEIWKNIAGAFSFPYALLKGAYLIQLYPPGLRTFNDIDVLIESQTISQLSRVLKKHNFQQGTVCNENFIPAKRVDIISSRMNRGETVPFVIEVKFPFVKHLEIDVNFSLGFKPDEDSTIVKKFLQKVKPSIRSGIYTLQETDFLLHLCAHLYKEATVMHWVNMGRDIALYKYCDVYLFVLKFFDAVFVADLQQRINELDLQKECYFALYYTKTLFDLTDPLLDRLLEAIRPADLHFMHMVFDPQTGQRYGFDMPYKEWVFCHDRRRNLHET